jgi:hypothetical protein
MSNRKDFQCSIEVSFIHNETKEKYTILFWGNDCETARKNADKFFEMNNEYTEIK